MARVILKHLTKSFVGPKGERIAALQDFSLSVNSCEMLAILGPSGCGKTTTLRILAGLESPESGTVAFDDQVVNHIPPKARDVAMVFQNPALYPHLSVYENLAFGLRIRKLPKAEIVRRVEEAANYLGLQDCLDRGPQELSGGQRQRVAIGRAMVRRPKVLLFDEPLSDLDAALRHQMRTELKRLHREFPCTVFYVTHDQSEALALGDRVAVMNEGKVQQVDQPQEVYQRPENLFVAGFIGSPPMNLFPGNFVRAGESVDFQAHAGPRAPGALSLCFRLPKELILNPEAALDRKIIMGLRPEHLTAGPDASQRQRKQIVAGLVEAVETTGAETIVRVAQGGTTFLARCRDSRAPKVGEKIDVAFDLGAAQVFDGGSGRRIQWTQINLPQIT